MSKLTDKIFVVATGAAALAVAALAYDPNNGGELELGSQPKSVSHDASKKTAPQPAPSRP